jgi:hypothetical protein
MKMRYSIPAALLALLIASAPASADIGYSATLDGLQEVPPNASPATGVGTITLNNAMTLLTYKVVYSGLTASRTASHFHGPAAAGVNAAVVFAIAAAGPTSDTITGTWAIDATNLARLNSGLLYLNVHSTTFPGGEIRGQVHSDVTPNRATTWGRIKQLYR